MRGEGAGRGASKPGRWSGRRASTMSALSGAERRRARRGGGRRVGVRASRREEARGRGVGHALMPERRAATTRAPGATRGTAAAL